ncbi:LutB/LldF family L-lactate oxidation iron-sulfur protein [Desmospora activa]|uniref:Lactate utilization protein B n=1 Tax=Desmospora activa DSM 45169 TaxID=1121389 RepID=A0A2T4ZD11_9BACL|nr:LutB/LldF family L-lactate oxidation iron-sulfur protein [Desmospora activa]PTM59752.1 L-lactate dehydrogenase complex protein LldF [Desmospora activa DSM 45169]
MSLKIGEKKFFPRVDDGLDNHFMRGAVRAAQDRLGERKQSATDELGDWEEWRSLGEAIRAHTLANLDYYLEELGDNVAKAGGHVFFAETAEEASDYIRRVVKEKQGRKIVKSKSMVTEEIGLNTALQAMGCDVVETDLGEYILQLDDCDPPSHIVAPVLHKNREQIREVFQQKRGYTNSSQPEELAAFAREQLRQEFLTADIGITGCNFAVAESGSVTLVTNEGNGRLCTTLPQTQITVMGMERIVPTWEELDIMVSLLCRAAVGQKLTSYVTGLTGVKAEGETDGPQEFHLVIVDNGRSDILGTEFQSVLHCIRCAACINVCPVYRHIGGHAYGSIYPGPIGAVLSPLLGGYDDYKELPYASSLCAACTEACPVKIPLHEHLVRHRRRIVEEENRSSFGERLAMKGFGLAASHPGFYEMATKAAPRVMSFFSEENVIKKGPGPLQAWTKSRDLPAPKRESFRQWFKKRQKKDEQP